MEKFTVRSWAESGEAQRFARNYEIHRAQFVVVARELCRAWDPAVKSDLVNDRLEHAIFKRRGRPIKASLWIDQEASELRDECLLLWAFSDFVEFEHESSLYDEFLDLLGLCMRTLGSLEWLHADTQLEYAMRDRFMNGSAYFLDRLYQCVPGKGYYLKVRRMNLILKHLTDAHFGHWWNKCQRKGYYMNAPWILMTYYAMQVLKMCELDADLHSLNPSVMNLDEDQSLKVILKLF